MLAGTPKVKGDADGLFLNATFHTPHGISIDESRGCIYVTDYDRYRVRKLDMEKRTVSKVAGNIYGCEDGVGEEAQFASLWGCKVNSEGYLFIADPRNGRARRMSPSGEVVSLPDLNMMGLYDLSVDKNGRIYAFHLSNVVILDNGRQEVWMRLQRDLITVSLMIQDNSGVKRHKIASSQCCPGSCSWR